MFEPGENEWVEDWAPPAEISRELFLAWREARRGSQLAEDMTNPVWLWLIDTNVTAYHANSHFKGPEQILAGDGPGWCFNRFGRTLTELPDGRKILIAGEHEDHYDPDFFIYNDVVIAEPDGTIRILGYPEEHFPPTDFHSATLIGDEILLIGSLGYGRDRRPGDTQVLALDLRTLTFRPVETSGDKPGWISRHEAALAPGGGAILIQGGMIDHGPDHGGYLENFDSWKLDLATWAWSRLTRKTILRWQFTREDGQPGNLFPMRMSKAHDMVAEMRKTMDIPDFGSHLPPLPEFDRELLASLYDPPVEYEVIAASPVDDRLRFVIDGVTVRFEENFGGGVMMIAEDQLPEAMLEGYVEQVRDRLSKLENCSYRAERLGI